GVACPSLRISELDWPNDEAWNLGRVHGGVASCGLTFELRRDRRCCAWPARRIMYQGASRAKCNAVGPRLERGVRRHGGGGQLRAPQTDRATQRTAARTSTPPLRAATP